MLHMHFSLTDYSFIISSPQSHHAFFVFLIGTNHHPTFTGETRKLNQLKAESNMWGALFKSSVSVSVSGLPFILFDFFISHLSFPTFPFLWWCYFKCISGGSVKGTVDFQSNHHVLVMVVASNIYNASKHSHSHPNRFHISFFFSLWLWARLDNLLQGDEMHLRGACTTAEAIFKESRNQLVMAQSDMHKINSGENVPICH